MSIYTAVDALVEEYRATARVVIVGPKVPAKGGADTQHGK